MLYFLYFNILNNYDQSTTDHYTSKTDIGTTIQTQGNIILQAGKNYTQTGSDVIAPVGDIHISAKKVDITAARQTRHHQTESQFKQSGATVALTSPVISAIQTAQQMRQAASDTRDPRMQALAAANMAFAGKNIWAAVAIAPSAPFAMAEYLSPEVWKAISILLGAAR